LKPIHEVNADTRAAIASIELDEQGRARKVKFLGAYERHNRQKVPNTAMQMQFVKAAALAKE